MHPQVSEWCLTAVQPQSNAMAPAHRNRYEFQLICTEVSSPVLAVIAGFAVPSQIMHFSVDAHTQSTSHSPGSA